MSDRNAARRRRSAQNKRERDARATRVAKARADSRAPATPARSGGARSGSRGRAAGQRSPGPSSLSQRWTDSGSPDPGARMVLLSVLLAVVAGVMLYFFDIVPVEEEVRGRTVVETTSLATEYGPRVIPFLAIPVLITAAAWFATRWSGRRRRRVYVVAAVMMWLWIMLNFTLGLLYIVSAISLSVGAWQYVNAMRGEAPETGKDEDEDEDVDVDEEVDEEVDEDEGEFDEDDDLDENDDGDEEAPDRPTVSSRLRGLFGR